MESEIFVTSPILFLNLAWSLSPLPRRGHSSKGLAVWAQQQEVLTHVLGATQEQFHWFHGWPLSSSPGSPRTVQSGMYIFCMFKWGCPKDEATRNFNSPLFWTCTLLVVHRTCYSIFSSFTHDVTLPRCPLIFSLRKLFFVPQSPSSPVKLSLFLRNKYFLYSTNPVPYLSFTEHILNLNYLLLIITIRLVQK